MRFFIDTANVEEIRKANVPRIKKAFWKRWHRKVL